MSSRKPTLYDVLDLGQDASTEAIVASFRRLSQIHHPDKNRGSDESAARFRVLCNAYEVLSSPGRRREYDAYLENSSVYQGVHRQTASSSSSTKNTQALVVSSPLPLLLNHLNYVLWDIEDLVSGGFDTERRIGQQTLKSLVLMMLSFIDRWVLEPAGHGDYFFTARKLRPPHMNTKEPDVPFRVSGLKHQPYVSVTDYMYAVRRRADRFLNQVKIDDLENIIVGRGLRLAECILEAHNYCFHYLGAIHEVVRGLRDEIPPFHSRLQA